MAAAPASTEWSLRHRFGASTGDSPGTLLPCTCTHRTPIDITAPEQLLFEHHIAATTTPRLHARMQRQRWRHLHYHHHQRL